MNTIDTAFQHRFGPWAVVTGASSGIGRELALQLAARGLDVLVCGRDAQRLRQVAAEIRAMGRQARTQEADLATQAGRDALVQAAQALDLGLLVPAAGFGTGGPFLATGPDEMHAMIALNCTAVSDMLLRLGPGLAGRGRGGILLVASVLGFHGVPYAAQYAATKAYVQSLGEALAVELADSGVRVVVSAPGPTATGFAERARMRLGRTMAAADVARASIAGLGRSGTLLPGGLSKLLHGAFFGWPRSARIRMMGRIMKGMT